jgi:hypothetical protein
MESSFLEGIIDGILSWKDLGKKVDEKTRDYIVENEQKASEYRDGAFFGTFIPVLPVAAGVGVYLGHLMLTYSN